METPLERNNAPKQQKFYSDDIDKTKRKSVNDEKIAPTGTNRKQDQEIIQTVKNISKENIRGEVEEENGRFRSKKPALIDSCLKDDKDKDNPPILESFEDKSKTKSGEKDDTKDERDGTKGEETSSKGGRVGTKDGKESTKDEETESKDGRDSTKDGKDGTMNEKNGTKDEKDDTNDEETGSKDRRDGTKDGKVGTMNEKNGTRDEKDGTKNEKDGTKDGKVGTMNEKDGTKDEKDGTKDGKDGIMNEKNSTKDEKDDTKNTNEIETIKQEKQTIEADISMPNHKIVEPERKDLEKPPIMETFEVKNETKPAEESSISEETDRKLSKNVETEHDNKFDALAQNDKIGSDEKDSTRSEKESDTTQDEHKHSTTEFKKTEKTEVSIPDKKEEADENIEARNLEEKSHLEEALETPSESQKPKDTKFTQEHDDVTEPYAKMEETDENPENLEPESDETREDTKCSGCNEPPINEIQEEEPKEKKGMFQKMKEAFMSEEEQKEQKYYENISKANKEIKRECKATSQAEKYSKKAETYLEKAQEKLKEKEDAHAKAEEFQEKAIIEAERNFEYSEMDLAHKADEIEKTASKFHGRSVET